MDLCNPAASDKELQVKMTAKRGTGEKRFEDIFNTVATAILEEDISELRKAIDDLKTQGVRDFKKYLDENPDFVRKASLLIRIVDANDAALKLYGADSKAELLGSLDKIFAQQSYDVLKQELLAIAEGREYFEAEDINFNLRGERIDIELHASIPPAGTEFESRLVSIIDITGRKKAENRLALQYDIARVLAGSDGIEEPIEEIIRLVCEINSWVIGEIWFVDRQAALLRLESIWNKPFQDTAEFVAESRKTSFRKGEGLPGRVWESGQPAWISDVIDDDNFLRTTAASRLGLHAAFAFPIKCSGKVTGIMSFFSQQIIVPDNDFLMMFDAIGSQIGSFIVRRQLEGRLHRYEYIVSSSKEHMSLIDRNYVYQSVNDSYLKAFNRRRDEIEGHSVAEIFGTETFEKTIKNYLDRCLNGETINYQSLFDFPGLGRRLMDVFYYPFYGAEGSVSGMVIISRDITENKKMEIELEKTHKLEAIGTLAGGIAHDFNNLLTAILGNISLTKMHMRPDDKDFKRLTDAENACMQATELSNRLIIFSKGGDPVRRIISINKMVDDTVCSALSGTNISCECKLPHDLNPVYADEGQIRECFRNMVINAIEAMPDGGVIRVNAENVTVNDSQVSGLKAGKYVKISIQDSGRGMPEEIMSRIFDPYFTTKEMGAQKGLGLGLAVCYSIIKKHDGHISVESNLNAGTVFDIYLSAVETEIKGPASAKTKVFGKKRVLIMDDEALVREVAGRILEHLGYEVEYAGDGHEAVEIYKKAKESGKVFDAVILDLTVRGGMGGDWAIRKLLDADPQVKAIVSSGYADNPIMTNFREYGFAAAMPKPYNVLQLKEALEKALAGQG